MVQAFCFRSRQRYYRWLLGNIIRAAAWSARRTLRMKISFHDGTHRQRSAVECGAIPLTTTLHVIHSYKI